jgi:hypothetical protein
MRRWTQSGEGGDRPAGGDRLALKVSKRRIEELEILHAAGKLGPEELRPDAWAGVAAILVKNKLDRTFLQATKLVVDRTDPIVEPERNPGVTVTNVTMVFEAAKSAPLPSHTNGHALPGVTFVIEGEHGNS